jgi:hypothetical protein
MIDMGYGTFDHAVGVVLSASLCIQGVLIPCELAAVETELVRVANEPVEFPLDSAIQRAIARVP